VLDDVIGTLQPMAAAKHLVLRQQPLDPKLAVRADARALQQILLNLTNNAVKFTASGHVHLSAQVRDGQVLLQVEDTGPGISAEDQARLFEAFSQVGDLRQRKNESTGLGLHLSRKLAELMAGRIEVVSEIGRGSRFTLVLQNAS
jgi:protein-histidine pros-kinase